MNDANVRRVSGTRSPAVLEFGVVPALISIILVFGAPPVFDALNDHPGALAIVIDGRIN